MTTFDGSAASVNVLTDAGTLLGIDSNPPDIYLTAANQVLVSAGECSATLLEDPLYSTLLTYLVAHFYTISNPEASSKSVNGASKSYVKGTVGDGLRATSFGRTAMSLDVTGCLDRVGSTRRAGVSWIGTAGDKRREPTEEVN